MRNGYCSHCGWPISAHEGYTLGDRPNGGEVGDYQYSLDDCPALVISKHAETNYQSIINALESDLQGYRITVNSYPEGGRIDAQNGKHAATAGWVNKMGTTLDDAVRLAKLKLGIE